MLKISEFKKLKNFIKASSDLKDELAFITSDNRNIQDENVFLAFVGERYNPLQDLAKLNKNIKYVVYEGDDSFSEKNYPHLCFIKVKNLIKFSQEAATLISCAFQKDNTLLVISGSNGKTTTKEMLSFVLRSNNLSFISTLKNNNNHLGVPLTIFQIRPHTKYAVIELGSNHPHEMEVLNSIVKPQNAVVTNIGYTHMEFFKSLEDVFLEEGNSFYYLKNAKGQKKFFRNEDDIFLKTLKGDFVISFGERGEDYKFSFHESEVHILNQGQDYKIKNEFITGHHNFFNLAVTFVLAKELFSLEEKKIIQSLSTFKPTKNRGEWIKYLGKDIFLDAYNANPSSMTLSFFGFIEKIGRANLNRALFILGDMNELGDKAEELHEKVGRELLKAEVLNVVFIGRYAASYCLGYPHGRSYFNTAQYVAEGFKEDIKSYDYIFIKGSRTLQLESILDIN